MSERQKDVTVRNEKQLFSPKTGEQIGFQRRVFAQFQRGGIPSWAMELAVSRFAMAGKPEDVDAYQWLCTYDSRSDQQVRGWTDDEHDLIVAKLRDSHGVFEIEPRKAEPPWPAYPKIVAVGRRTAEKVVEQILEGIDTTGVDPDAVVAFERQELARPEVIEAVEALKREEEEPEPLIAA